MPLMLGLHNHKNREIKLIVSRLTQDVYVPIYFDVFY